MKTSDNKIKIISIFQAEPGNLIVHNGGLPNDNDSKIVAVVVEAKPTENNKNYWDISWYSFQYQRVVKNRANMYDNISIYLHELDNA